MVFFFFQAEDGIRDVAVTGVQTCALPISKLNAFVHLDADRARAQARAAETAVSVSEPPGPLRGVPLTIKSCIDVAGWPCPAGSLLRKDYVPRTDEIGRAHV